IVSAAHIAELKAALSADGQAPTTDALDHQIQAFIDEEIMVREAKTLGLDRGDMIIRRRLIQKMSFVIDDMASANPPSVGEMEAWLKSNSERYSTPARLSLEHCYFSRDRRGEAARTSAEASLAAWRQSGVAPKGDPFLGGRAVKRRTPKQIERQFGQQFVAFVEREGPKAAASQWLGPVESPFGYHLVRMMRYEPDRPATLDRVQARVYADMMAARKREAAGQARIEMRTKYPVSIEKIP
ncbi:MAG: peptidylprolyl isomerase, partial [Myxococcota bacterium]|nr:peptidylprolyl isomerase [Myxococcota bacterium]